MSALVDLAALGTRDMAVQGDATNDRAGLSISGAGDFNGDGFADFIIGAKYNDVGGTDSGSAYVIYGHAGALGSIDLSNLSPSQGLRIQGDAPGDLAGMSVSGAGDVNGDGFADVVVGGDRLVGQFGYGDTPLAYVVFGRSAQSGTIDLTGLSPADGFKITGPFESSYYRFGTVSVSKAGDVNGDGFDDIIIGTQYGAPGHTYTGAAYVVFGKAGGFTDINLGTLGADQGFVIRGAATGDEAGASVSAAGDINGDGFADIIIGAPGSDLGGTNAGGAYVVFGKAGGFGTITLSDLAPPTGFVIMGDAPNDRAGSSVSSAGDVNGDGYDDLIIGAPLNDSGGADAGAAYVIFGKPGGFGTIDLSNLGSAGFKIQGDAAGDEAGYSVAGAGDVNHDGYADVIIGAISNDTGRMDAGRAYVIFGKAAGFGTVDLTNLSPTQGFIIQGAAAADFAGWSVSGAGDTNRDGFADVVVGAPFNASGGQAAGAGYLVLGTGILTSPLGHAADFNGDGRDDVLWRSGSGRVTDWLGQASGGFATNFGSADANAGLNWHIAAMDDFNGDGRGDLLWRSASGDMFGWLGQANGGFLNNSSNFYVNVDPSWQIAASGDFNGDGRGDLLWRDASGRVTDWLGQANGGFVSNFANADAAAGLDWHIAATGDFNGDNRTDILWRNDNGDLFDWLSQPGGGFASNSVNSYVHIDTSWQVVGSGDFNGDGRDDILWRDNTGRVTDWLGQANGGFVTNFANADANAGLRWQIVSTGDFNGDGRDDILWRNDNGDLTDWLGQANGGFSSNVGNAYYGVDHSWNVVGIA